MKEKYSDEQLLEMLHVMAERLGHRPTQTDLLRADDMPTIAAYMRRFGSWNKALERAGFEGPFNQLYPIRFVPRYTDEQMLEALREAAKKLGHTPGIREIGRGFPSADAYRRHFGSWEKAIELAGLPKRARKCNKLNRYSDEELLEILREVSKELGRTPKMTDFRKGHDNMPSAGTFVIRFGSWTAALEKAGFNDDSDGMILEALRRLASELGRTPGVRDVSKSDKTPSVGAYVGRFGTLSAALEEAGIPEEYAEADEAYAREQVEQHHAKMLEALRDFAKKIGRTPSTTDAQRFGLKPCFRSYYRHFGSWEKALEAAGL